VGLNLEERVKNRCSLSDTPVVQSG